MDFARILNARSLRAVKRHFRWSSLTVLANQCEPNLWRPMAVRAVRSPAVDWSDRATAAVALKLVIFVTKPPFWSFTRRADHFEVQLPIRE